MFNRIRKLFQPPVSIPQPNGSFLYKDERRGFEITVPPGWAYGPMKPLFVETGGVRDFEKRHGPALQAHINISTGRVPPQGVLRDQRMQDLRRYALTAPGDSRAADNQVEPNAVTILDEPAFLGTMNVVHGTWRLDAGRGGWPEATLCGLISAVFDSAEWVIQYRRIDTLQDEVKNSIRSFRFSA